MKNVIEIRRVDAVATVELNRPEKKNALNLTIWRDLAEVFGRLSDDASLRCVVLRGQGTDVFAAGADIDEFAQERSDAGAARRYDDTLRRGLAAVALCPHPTIAQIYGPCLGAGLELAAQCDLRIAARSARFGVPVGKISVVMPLPELAGLQRLVGPARMAEILLEARVFGAEDAASMGLVQRVVPDERMEEELAATLRRILGNAPLVNRIHKAFIRRVQDNGQPFSPADVERAYDCLATSDYAEGMAAFAEKRPPNFTGR